MAIYYAAAGLAERARPYGIRVNRVAPGLMLTNEATRRQWAAYGADRQRALVEGIALRRLGCAPEREIDQGDQFMIARSAKRSVVLVIDGARDVLQSTASDTISAANIVTGLEHIQGVIRLPDGLVLIQDLDLFLSAAESRALDEALPGTPHGS